MNFFKYFYTECLQEVLKKPKVLGFREIKLIFLVALGDFLRNKINIEDFSSIANELYYNLKKPNWFDNFPDRLGYALEDATEIDYYYKKANGDKTSQKIYNSALEDLKEYYEENKSLLGEEKI